MFVKCGKCNECRAERSRNWVYKLHLESKNYIEKCFITLTYAENPYNLEKEELQKFIKRLRKHIGPENKIKYFAAGEYGTAKGRAHYHIIILGWQPEDMKLYRGQKSSKGNSLYRSEIVKKLWGKGRITVQKYHPNETGYIALYVNKNDKINKLNQEVELIQHKIRIKELQCKYGILHKQEKDNFIKDEPKYIKIKMIKDMEKTEFKKYKKDYLELLKKYKPKKINEFNIWSKGLGFENFIKNEFWKYDFNLEGKKYEMPKEYIRKILENKDNYNEEIVNNITMEALKRKEYAEQEYAELLKLNNNQIFEIGDNAYNAVITEEARKISKQNDKKRLAAKIESPF